MNGTRTVFIISEYNPFHNGHAHQIETIRRDLAPQTIVSIMSGHFVQRGEPAILDKFSRARLAIAGGSDLVVELPVIHAASSAEFFARGGTAIAAGLDPGGILSFGSESGDLEQIITVARTLTDHHATLDGAIREGLARGLTYPAARARALEQVLPDRDLADVLSRPNDILGIEYVRAAHSQGLSLGFHTLRRQGMGYHEDTPGASDPGHHPSATALRNAMRAGDFETVSRGMPPACRPIFDETRPRLLLGESTLKHLIHYRLSLFPESLENLPEAAGGLGERIAGAAGMLPSHSLREFALAVKTRRFTYSRIRRLLLHLALGFDELDYDARRRQMPPYTRILALNAAGQAFLAKTRKTRQIQVIQSAREIDADLFRPDLHAARLYSLLQSALPADADFTHPLRVQS